MTSETRRRLIDFVVSSAKARLLIYAELAHETYLICSADTIRRTLNAESFRRRISAPKLFLSAINQRKRLEYAQAHQYWDLVDWYNVIWTDESAIHKRNWRR